jgi:hypothetical protein
LTGWHFRGTTTRSSGSARYTDTSGADFMKPFRPKYTDKT